MSDLHLELLSLWDKLDSVPEPAPSHRNRTMTAWADAISAVRKGLTNASNRALAMQLEIARLTEIASLLRAQVAEVTWRPVVDGGEMPPNDKPVLAVVWDGVQGASGRRWVVRAKYVGRFTIPDNGDFIGEAEYDPSGFDGEDMYWWPEGWYEWNEFDETHYMINGTVTHWSVMPGLPEVVE